MTFWESSMMGSCKHHGRVFSFDLRHHKGTFASYRAMVDLPISVPRHLIDSFDSKIDALWEETQVQQPGSFWIEYLCHSTFLVCLSLSRLLCVSCPSFADRSVMPSFLLLLPLVHDDGDAVPFSLVTIMTTTIPSTYPMTLTGSCLYTCFQGCTISKHQSWTSHGRRILFGEYQYSRASLLGSFLQTNLG